MSDKVVVSYITGVCSTCKYGNVMKFNEERGYYIPDDVKDYGKKCGNCVNHFSSYIRKNATENNWERK